MAISVLFSNRSNERSIVNSKDEYSDKKKTCFIADFNN